MTPRIFPVLAGVLTSLSVGSLHAGLDINASPTPLAPPTDSPTALVHHAFDDSGGKYESAYDETTRTCTEYLTPPRKAASFTFPL
jgi:hypothetical protein